MFKSSYLRRFALLLASCVFLTSAGVFLLTVVFANMSNDNALESTLLEAHNAGRKIEASYAAGEMTEAELNMQLNPYLNTGNAFWILLDNDTGRVLCASESVLPQLSEEGTTRFLKDLCYRLEPGTVTALSLNFSRQLTCRALAEKLEGALLITGIPAQVYSGISGTLFMRMLITIPLLTAFILLIGNLFTRRTARPAVMIFDAAARIRTGEELSLPQDMPGETGEIARAFNQLTRTVRETFTQLRQEKETMELVIESLHEGILAADEKGELIHRNSAALDLLGGEESEAYAQVWQAVLSREEGCTGKLNVGESILQYTVTLLPGQGDENGSAALIRDITEEERLERTRHDYVANISHELRTPLASIRGLAEGLRDNMVSDEAQRMRYYNIIADEANRLARLVNDLLELSGLQSNPAAFDMEKVDPAELIWDLSDRNTSLFEQAGLTLKLEVPSQEGELPRVISNEDRLSQVMTIFLDNARKYTPAGGTVTLGAERTAAGVRLFVRDTGIGMDEETQRHAFERFHQAERGRSDKGSGLGLAIARQIMLKMNISIRLVSEKGKGSEFSFEIPV